MIIWKKGDLLQSECKTLVNTVNCVGVMGKGIALAFKKAYPKMFLEYREACFKHEIKPGYPWIWRNPDDNSLFDLKHDVLCFPTKDDWRNPSKIEWIDQGLKIFADNYKYETITSIAFPKLGCANGRLDWTTQVKPLMIKHLSDLTDIFIEIYE